jgi:hypothetical protein
MKEYVTSRFSKGALIRNARTSEDGKIDDVLIDDDCTVKYSVHLPMDSHGWELGTRAVGVLWDESEVTTSPNEFLK